MANCVWHGSRTQLKRNCQPGEQYMVVQSKEILVYTDLLYLYFLPWDSVLCNWAHKQNSFAMISYLYNIKHLLCYEGVQFQLIHCRAEGAVLAFCRQFLSCPQVSHLICHRGAEAVLINNRHTGGKIGTIRFKSVEGIKAHETRRKWRWERSSWLFIFVHDRKEWSTVSVSWNREGEKQTF